MSLIRKYVNSYPMTIYVAGDIDLAKGLCQQFCDKIGWCVTVTPTTYVYRDGNEPGIAVGIINYAKYPQHPAQLWDRAEHLAEYLVAGLFQHSCSIQGPNETVHYEFGAFWEINPSWQSKHFDGADHSLTSDGDHKGLITYYASSVKQPQPPIS